MSETNIQDILATGENPASLSFDWSSSPFTILLVFLLSFYLYLRFLRDRMHDCCGYIFRCGKKAKHENRETEAEVEDMKKEIRGKKSAWVSIKKTKVGQKVPLIIEK